MTQEEFRLACLEQALKMTLSAVPIEERAKTFMDYVSESEILLGCLRVAIGFRGSGPRITPGKIVEIAREFETIVMPQEKSKKRGRPRKTF